MPENVPPKETARADGLNPAEQAPGVPRDSMADDALARAKAKAATDPSIKVEGGEPARKAAADPDARPGANFVRINWKEKIGGHEKDGEWCEERRAQNLVGSGHAEIVEEKEEEAKK